MTPEEAPAVFAEAVRVLAGEATQEQVAQAHGDLTAACDPGGLTEACDYLREKFSPPIRYAMVPATFPDEVNEKRTVAIVIADSTLGTDGRPRDIKVVESASPALTGIVVRSLASMRFHPATLAGHPIEIRYGMQVSTHPATMNLTPQEELAWGWIRAKTFPRSHRAWLHVARVLARDNPKDPGYEQALREVNFLAPKYWWSATELAWLYADAGRYEEAAPLALLGRRKAPDNSYALETSARVAFHQNRCQEAIQEQQQALTKLPEAWPREERERFSRTLADYQRQCAAGSSPVRDGSVPGT
ncbi:hypothetical protein [Myxococcus stipitatus]|uniref:hypothetical protein n=1 Tax=Myxococcus stipitatus TaxID=83455 RepID=UPI0030CA9C11